MGVALAEDLIPDDRSEEIDVFPANWPSVCAFLGCQTQWRVVVAATGLVWLGLDYTAVDVVLRRTAVADVAFADIQLMERAALDAFAEVS